jgi:hypothetical protein
LSYQRSGISLFNPILQIHCKPCFVGRSVYVTSQDCRTCYSFSHLVDIVHQPSSKSCGQRSLLFTETHPNHRQFSLACFYRALSLVAFGRRGQDASPPLPCARATGSHRRTDSSLLPSSLSPHSPRAHELSTHWSKQLPTRPTKQTTTCPVAEMSRVVRKQRLNRPSWSPGLPVLVSVRNGPSGFARL